MHTSARLCAATLSHVATIVVGPVISARKDRVETSLQLITEFVDNFVDAIERRVAMRAARYAMARKNALHVSPLARFGAVTPGAASGVTNLAPPAPSKPVLQGVHTPSVQCPVLHLAIGFPAPSDVRCF